MEVKEGRMVESFGLKGTVATDNMKLPWLYFLIPILLHFDFHDISIKSQDEDLHWMRGCRLFAGREAFHPLRRQHWQIEILFHSPPHHLQFNGKLQLFLCLQCDMRTLQGDDVHYWLCLASYTARKKP